MYDNQDEVPRHLILQRRNVNISSIEGTTTLIGRCVDSIVIEEEVYTSVDMAPDEISEWLDALDNRTVPEDF